MDEKEKEFAKHYASTRCGVLHANWAMDAFWGEVTKEVILPTCVAIHDELVKRAQEKGHSFNDADDTIFYIPSENKKVFVHTTQCRDYLFIINQGYEGFPDLHIRRIYREINEEDYALKEIKNGGINAMLQHAEWFEEHHDDHYKLSNRPSLKAYRKAKFQIPHIKNLNEDGPSFYGDFRDSGYVLSYEGWLGSKSGPRVEGSRFSANALETIATCYLPCIADELEITVPKLNGYGR